MERNFIAKITRPSLPKVLVRNRLFRLLDKSRTYPVIWICGPAGSGKTTLVSSYLDSKEMPCIWYQLDAVDSDLATFFYYMGIAGKRASPRKKKPLPLFTLEYAMGASAFARRYFEELFSRLKRPCAVVLDNYQEVLQGSPFHSIIQECICCIPEDIKLFLISRTEPPVEFTRIRANSHLKMIGWNELRFTPEESGNFVRFLSKDKLSPELIEKTNEKAQGWAAGIILATERPRNNSADFFSSAEIELSVVFDYFAAEIFDRLDRHRKDLLLRTAPLTVMTAETAAELSGNKSADQILRDLSRGHFFTERLSGPDPAYRYHPLFRDFLLSRLKEAFGPEEISEINERAAACLERMGRIENAAEIYIELRNQEKLTGLILDNSGMLISQGRNRTLDIWFAALPESTFEMNPWLLYWKGVCRFLFDPREGQSCFEKAFQIFESNEDASGIFLAWAGIVEAIELAFENMHQLDKWIKILPALLNRLGGFPSQEIETRVASAMLPALVMRQPRHKNFDFWLKKALAVEDINSKINMLFHLAFHYLTRGHIIEGRAVMESLNQITMRSETGTLGKIKDKLVCQLINALSDCPDECSRNLHEAMQIAEKSGIHAFDFMLMGNGANISLMYGDFASAREMITTMARSNIVKPWDKARYHNLAAMEAYLLGDIKTACMHSDLSLGFANQVGVAMSKVWCSLTTALILNEKGEHAEADKLLEEALTLSFDIGSRLGKFECYLTKAQCALHRGDNKQVLAALKEGMKTGREMGLFCEYYVLRRPNDLSRLTAAALENGIETDYIQELIRRRNLVPDEKSPAPENWPWPVKIFTLGAFRILLNDKSIAFTGKIQKKPLEMLKIIIAFGPKGASEEKITDSLWPEAEGDSGRISFKTTLHRLRQLIGNENAIIFQDGRLSLDRRFCWTDIDAFERALNEAENVEMERAATLIEKAFSLYKGHFLPEDEKSRWTISARERIKSKFLDAVGWLSNYYMKKKDFKKAVSYYSRGLEMDDLEEEFYRGLIRCHLSLGSKADAVKTFERCKKMLGEMLGVEPSKETMALIRNVKKTNS